MTGKPVGNDLARRKATLPVVAALNSRSEAATELAALYQAPAAMTASDVERATALVKVAGVVMWRSDAPMNASRLLLRHCPMRCDPQT